MESLLFSVLLHSDLFKALGNNLGNFNIDGSFPISADFTVTFQSFTFLLRN